MTKQFLSFSVIALLLGAAPAETSWGRGFGGMHGGMGGGGMAGGMGGGMRGGMGGGMRGGMGGGAMGGGMRGGMGGGGMRPGGANLGGGRPGGSSPSGLGNRGPSFGGAGPSQSRTGSGGGFGAGRPGGAGAGERGFPGGAAGGFGAGRTGPATVGGPREPGAAGVGQRPDRSQLGNFLGLPSDGGLHAAAGGNRLGRDQRGLSRYPDADLRRHGDDVRRDFHGRDFYSADWYRRYPGAWYPRAWTGDEAWAAATWDSMNNWLGYANTQPTYYDYGNNVTYQDNSVSMNGQDMGTPDQYYQQAQDLASTGASAPSGDDQQWLPLGVFAMTHDQQTKANLILQLAINKQGIIRGNYTATLTNDTKPVNGSVDKKTQRAAWTIGDNKDNVIETGIYNLTKDEAPVLVHFGKDKTEQWLLVRVKQDQQEQTDQKPAT